MKRSLSFLACGLLTLACVASGAVAGDFGGGYGCFDTSASTGGYPAPSGGYPYPSGGYPYPSGGHHGGHVQTGGWGGYGGNQHQTGGWGGYGNSGNHHQNQNGPFTYPGKGGYGNNQGHQNQSSGWGGYGGSKPMGSHNNQQTGGWGGYGGNQHQTGGWGGYGGSNTNKPMPSGGTGGTNTTKPNPNPGPIVVGPSPKPTKPQDDFIPPRLRFNGGKSSNINMARFLK